VFIMDEDDPAQGTDATDLTGVGGSSNDEDSERNFESPAGAAGRRWADPCPRAANRNH